MDSILQAFLSLSFIFLALCISAITFIIRKIVEYLLETHTVNGLESKLWKGLVLPILPLIIGSLAALFKNYIYPTGFGSASGRFVFGIVAGMFAGLVYKMVNEMMGEKIRAIMASRTPDATAVAASVTAKAVSTAANVAAEAATTKAETTATAAAIAADAAATAAQVAATAATNATTDTAAADIAAANDLTHGAK